jgi:hypothetical protein
VTTGASWYPGARLAHLPHLVSGLPTLAAEPTGLRLLVTDVMARRRCSSLRAFRRDAFGEQHAHRWPDVRIRCDLERIGVGQVCQTPEVGEASRANLVAALGQEHADDT